MPGVGGLEVQAKLKALGFSLPIIVITGQGDIQTAVRAMKAGASISWKSPTRTRFC